MSTAISNQLTIIIPSRNRHSYLKRAIAYAETLPYRIIVADSSATAINDLQIKAANVEYHHLGAIDYTDKLNFCLSKVTTPYTMLCADDDFLIKDGVESCISFLEKNKSFVCCQGKTISFLSKEKEILFSEMYSPNSFAVSSSNFEERVVDYYHPYRPIFYAVHRTENLRKAFSIKVQPLNLNLTEYAMAFISAVNGEWKLLTELYHFREQLPLSAGAVHQTLQQSISNKNEFDKFQLLLKTYLIKEKEITDDIATKILKQSLSSYLNFVKGNKKDGSKNVSSFITKQLIKPTFPKLFSNLVFLKNKMADAAFNKSDNASKRVFEKLNLEEQQEILRIVNQFLKPV